MAAEIRTFTCLNDNFGYLIHDVETKATASIDAPEAGPILEALEREGWQLTDILITHHHGDHVGGVAELKQKYNCRVVAPHDKTTKIANVDLRVANADVVKIGNLLARVVETRNVILFDPGTSHADGVRSSAARPFQKRAR